ncbi:MAG: lysostaphin resistance A-like protein [Planctomycetota bacterium]
MIAAALPDVGFENLLQPLPVAGLVLLLLYVWLRVRGKEVLPRGPSPTTQITLSEAIAVYLAAFVTQMFTGMAGLWAGMREGPWLILMSLAGPVLIALAAWKTYLAGREGGPVVRGALAGLLAWLATMPVVAAVLVAWTRLLEAAGREVTEQAILTELREDKRLFLIVAVVLAPLTEEIFFRGLIYPALRRHVGFVLALVLSAAGFALVHWNPAVVPAIFVLGIALGYVYERTGTLAAPIAFHVAFNGLTFLGELSG